ncbi:serine/threonine-protein kinase [Actinocorallia aurantiaca]|uniref:Protein kinase domain-containing protein n=1 Tax=Actinocorallia aurantiaca TaxID=46204 RepID=A0ABN3U1G7_9ACTN
MDPLQPGDPRQVGEYRLVGRLGEGGQAVVYLGETTSEEHVAVKLRDRVEGGSERRFNNEVEALKTVPKRYTTELLDYGRTRKYLYIVTEYVEGESLRQMLDRRGRVDAALLKELALGTIAALAEFHEKEVVHRDFKPENVLCGSQGPPRVIDFGIARAPDFTVTEDTWPVGTIVYMSPEQLSGGEIGPASDVFSWAVTMAYAATGKHPYRTEGGDPVARRIRHELPDLGSFREEWRLLLARCLDRDPSERPTAAEVLNSLGAMREPGAAVRDVTLKEPEPASGPGSRGGSGVVPPRRPDLSSDPPGPSGRELRLLPVLAVLVAGALVAGLGWWGAVKAFGDCPQPAELRVMVPPEDQARFQHEYAPAFEAEKSGGGCRRVHLTVFAQPSLEALRAAFEGGWSGRLPIDPQPDVWLPSSSAEKDYVDPAHQKTGPPSGFHRPALSVLGRTEGSLMVAAATPLAKERLKGWESGPRRGWPELLNQAEAEGVEVVRPNPDASATGTLGSTGLYTDPEVLDSEDGGKPKVDLQPFERHMTKTSPQDAHDALCTANLKGRAAVAIVSEHTMNEYNDAPDKGCGEGRDQGFDKLSALYPETTYRLDHPFVRISWPEDREEERDSYARDLYGWMAERLPATERWREGSRPLGKAQLEATQRLLKEAGGGRTVEFLFDLTSSMEWTTKGTPRLRIAQDLVHSVLPELWGKDRMGLWAFPGARGSGPELRTPRLPGAKDRVEHLGTDQGSKKALGDGVDGLRADRDLAPLYEAIAVRAESLDSADPPGVLVVFTDEAGVDSTFSSADLRSKLVSLKDVRVVVVVLSGEECKGELTLLAAPETNLKCLAFGDEVRSEVLTEIRRISDE